MAAQVNKSFQHLTGLRIWSGFQGTSWNEELKELIHTYRVGGLVLFKRNIEDEKQIKNLIEQIQIYALEKLKRSLFIAVDQEGGTVKRFPFIDTPPARSIGNMLKDDGREEAISRYISTTASMLSQLGINVNLAPVMDIVIDPERHCLGTRSFGGDPETVSKCGALWISIHKRYKVHSVAKHFPGMSKVKTDPHFEETTLSWETPMDMINDLKPFETAIKTGAFGMMISHGRYPLWDTQWPGPLSSIICREWLRERLSFNGLILSDDLDMRAIKHHFTPEEITRHTTLAGIDCLLVCNDPHHREILFKNLVDAVVSNYTLREAHEASLIRILKHLPNSL